MIFQKVNRTDAEKVYIVAKNGFATTLTAGYVCCFDFAGDSTGTTVSQPQATTNSTLAAVAGVAASNIAAAGYGLIQVYGVGNAVLTSTESADDSSQIGQKVGPVTGEWAVFSYGASTKSGAQFVMAEAATSTAAEKTNRKVFIRAL